MSGEEKTKKIGEYIDKNLELRKELAAKAYQLNKLRTEHKILQINKNLELRKELAAKAYQLNKLRTEHKILQIKFDRLIDRLSR